MKALLAFSLCGILFACSPKFQIRNGDGFGGGVMSQKLVTKTNYTRYQIYENFKTVDSQNLQQSDLAQVNFEHDNFNNLSLRGRGYENVKIKKSLFEAIKESRSPKVKNSLTQKIFRNYLQKNAKADNSMVDIWFKVFTVAIVTAGALIVLALFLLLSGSWYTALYFFTAGYYLGIFSLIIGSLTLILWLLTM